MSNQFESSIEVEASLSQCYNQWTQFEEFPQFMSSVKEVSQIDDTHLHWVADIAGHTKEWDAEIIEQKPDRAISWKAIDGTQNAGAVVFDAIDQNHTKITLKMEFEPDGAIEKIGSTLGVPQNQANTDLQNFARFIEERNVETGAWRGEVHNGEKEDFKAL